ncbi:MAG: hypothetical protein AB7I27_18010 [Bacteriovoracaceae bacterium]
MSVEWFIKLKEIDSLNKSREGHLKAKKEQEERISKLLSKRQEALDELENFKKLNSTIQSNILDLEMKLKRAEEQKQRLLDIGGDEGKIKKFAEEASQLEDLGFSLLEQSESNQIEIKDKKLFLDGIEKTISEIKSEAESEIAKELKEIENIDLRVKLLENELPDDFKQILHKVQKKNLAHGPFTRIEAGSCYFCRYKISRLEESEIDMQKGMKTCPQCGRIFLPYGS